jgi:hypothetical protein
MDERKIVPNYRTVGHHEGYHEGLWMPKVRFLLFFSVFCCFCWLPSYLCLMFCSSMERRYLFGFCDGAIFLLVV